MTLRHMKVFITVCRARSMTSAAKELYTSQPAVSAVISELEQNYGVKLFDRMSKQLYLTGAGEKMLSYAEHITQLFGEMDQVLRDADAVGTLRVGITLNIGEHFSQSLVQLKGKYPGLKTSVIAASTRRVVESVLKNDLDIALVEGHPENPYLVTVPCITDRLVFVCANGHPFAGREDVELEELVKEPMLLLAKGTAARDHFDGMLALHGLSADPAWQCGSSFPCLHGAKHGLGITVLPLLHISSWLSDGRASLFGVKGLEMPYKITAICHKKKHLTQSARDLIELWKEQ